MRAFRRFMTRALLLGLAAFLIVPMVIPFDSSGTKTNIEAAGVNAEFALVNDINVHVDTEPYSGNRVDNVPLFILMHGFGASTFSWRYAMDSLSKQGEVLAYDRPGFGFTDRPTSWTGTNPYGFAGNFELTNLATVHIERPARTLISIFVETAVHLKVSIIEDLQS